MKQSTWIYSPKFDTIWFVFPQLIPAICIFFLPNQFLNNQRTEIFPISWILIVLAIDVAHVYSSVYKTYFKEDAWCNFGFKMKYLPVFVWMGGILIYSTSSYLFWSCLAYFAVYHFVRQQYGFFRLYSLPSANKWYRKILSLSIYASTVVPILIWHCKGQQNFNWMLAGDFKYINLPFLVSFLKMFYFLIHLVYIYIEFKEYQFHKKWNIGRMLITLSTSFAWYSSIVLINNDFTFSLVNVIGHGIPYFALVWVTEKRELNNSSSDFFKFIFSKWGWICFYLIIFGFAYIEEGLWDSLIWHEHSETFGWIYPFFDLIESDQVLAFMIPLLIMPQVVHYILDAYIWKSKK